MSRALAFGLALLALRPGCNAPAPPPLPPPAPGPALPLGAVNAYRAVNGLRPLIPAPAPTARAQAWAASMASRGVMGHQPIPPGTAENVGMGYPTQEAAAAGWYASAPHRANMLGAYTFAGIGAARAADGTVYWCLDLGP